MKKWNAKPFNHTLKIDSNIAFNIKINVYELTKLLKIKSVIMGCHSHNIQPKIKWIENQK